MIIGISVKFYNVLFAFHVLKKITVSIMILNHKLKILEIILILALKI